MATRQTSDRNATVDIAKGLGILLIAFWHSPLKEQLPTFHAVQQTFAVPLFFFLSGVLFKPEAGLLSIAHSKADSLLKPYATTLFVVAAFATWRVSLGTPNAVLKSALYATGGVMPMGFAPLWFLPALFLATLTGWAGIRAMQAARLPAPARWVAIGGVLILGASTLHGLATATQGESGDLAARIQISGWPWSLDFLPISAAWFMSGIELSGRAKRMTSTWPALLAALVAFLLVFSLAAPRMDLNMRVYSPVIATTTACALGIFITLKVSALLTRIKIAAATLTYIGSMSLFVLCFHLWLGSGFGYAIAKYGIAPQGPWRAAAVLVASVVLSLLLGWAIQRTFFLRVLFLPVRPALSDVSHTRTVQ
jgi:fucose 4-O-acetylase-like acetyltransferase